MDLTKLSDFLKGKGSPLTIDAVDANLQPEFQTFVGTMPNKKITLTSGKDGIKLQNNVLSINGTSSDDWSVQGLYNVSLTLTSVAITIDGSKDPPAFSCVAQAGMPLSTNVTVPVVVKTLNQEYNPWEITFGQNAPKITPMQAVLLGKESGLPFDIPPEVNFFDTALTVDPEKYSILFYPNTEYESYTRLTLNAPSVTWKPIDIFSFNGVDISAVLKTNSVSITLTGHLIVNQVGIDVGICMSGSPNWMVFVRPTPPAQAFPGLAALADWIGGSTLATSVSSGFSGVNVKTDGFDAAIASVTAGISISPFALTYLDIKSLLTIGALQLDVVLRLPGITIYGRLHNQQPVKVSDLLTSLSLPTTAVPDILTISKADFTAALKDGFYSIALVIDNVWTAGPLSLEQISLSIVYSPYDGLTGTFGCQFGISSTANVLLLADYGGSDTGWTFSGGLDPETPLAIGDMLAHLADKFGISNVPQPLQSLVLTELYVSYSTGTGAFTFDCGGTFKVDDTNVALSIEIKVLPAQSGQPQQGQVNGTKGYNAFFSGKLTIKGLVFDVVFDTASTGTNVFIAAYHNTGSGQIVLHDLVAAISTTLAPAIPQSLEIDLKQVKFIFFGQNDTKQFSFGLNLGTSISLSDLPVIGDKLPADLSIGVNNLQVGYNSAAFTKEQVTIINALLPSEIYPLPADGMSQGVQISGDLNVGGETKTLTVGSGSDSSNNNTESTPPALSAPDDSTPPSKITWFTIQKQFGPVQFQRIGVEYDNNVLSFALDASVMLGPVTISMDGLTFGSPLSRFEPVFDLHGLGVAYSAPPLTIMGGILKLPDSELPPDVKFQFDGTVTVEAEQWGLTALASYAQMKDGMPSLFVFARLDATLGGPPYFIVEGVMGGFGFNRNLQMPNFDEVMDFPLLAMGASHEADAKNDALSVLEILEGEKPDHAGKTKKWIEPKAGDYWLAAGLKFTSFELVHGELLLLAEFGKDLQFALLGLAWMRLPQGAPDSETYVYVELQLAAVLKPTEGYFGISAVLTPNSYVISKDCHLTGGFAFCIWFGSNANAGQFVMTVGGYHPAFKPPIFYPLVPRVGFNWAVSGDVSVKGGAYFAVTPSCGMAGGGLEVLFHSGDLRAWFIAQADMMITWNPFSFRAGISIEIGVSYRLNLLVCHKTISVSLGASLDLWGPPTGGRVKVHVVVVTFTVSFGSDDALNKNYEPLAWTDFKALLPDPNDVCKISASKGLSKTLDKTTNGINSKVWVVRSGGFSFFTQSAIPAAALTSGSLANAVQNVSGNNISIRPMNQTNVVSTHNLQIIYGSPDGTPVDTSQWLLTPNKTNMPETLWGNPQTVGGKFVQNPSKPTANVIPDQLTGYSVSAPAPVIGATTGLVPITELMEEYINPPGGQAQNPLSVSVQPSQDYIPVYNEESVNDISQISALAGQRTLLYNALKGFGFYDGNNAAMNLMGADAGNLFTDAPLSAVQ